MTNKLRTVTFIILGLFLAFVAFSYIVAQNAGFPTKPVASDQISQEMPATQNAHIIIDFGDNETFETDYSFTEDETALDALKAATSQNDITLETKDYDFGVLVTAIAGRQNSPDLAWIYFVNDESASVGVDQYVMQNGDTVEWRYIQPEF